MAVEDHITDPSLAAVLETSQTAREQALALVDLVASSTSGDQHSTLSNDALAEISKQQKLLNTSLAHLRGTSLNTILRLRYT